MLWKSASGNPSDVKFMKTGKVTTTKAVGKVAGAATNAQYFLSNCRINNVFLIPHVVILCGYS